MTTNAGSTYAQNKPGFTSNPKGLTEDKTKRALEDFLLRGTPPSGRNTSTA